MRKFFPLKQISGVRNSSEGVDYSLKDDSRRKATAASKERTGSTEALDEHALYHEVTYVNSLPRRQHWCPACSEDTGTSCNTPSSCDENLVLTDGDDTVVGSNKRLLTLNGIRGSHLREEFREQVPKSRSRLKNNPLNVDRCSSGTGNKGIETSVSKPSSTPTSPLQSVGELKHTTKGSAQSLSSIAKAPERRRLFSPTVQSILSERKQSSCQSNDLLIRETSGLPPLNLRSGSIRYSGSISSSPKDGPSIMSQPRSYSFSDSALVLDKCVNGSEMSSITSLEGRSCRKSGGNQTQKDASSSVSTDRSHSKYLTARAIAERLAKAIKGSSKSSPRTAKCPSERSADIMSSNFQPFYETKSRTYDGFLMDDKIRHSSREHKYSECSEITFDDVPCLSLHNNPPGPVGGFGCIAKCKCGREQTASLLSRGCLSDGKSEMGKDKRHEMELEASINGQSWTTDTNDQVGQRRQFMAKKLESFIRCFDSSNEELQAKARSAEERAVSCELGIMVVDDFILQEHDDLFGSTEGLRISTAAKLLEVQRKLRELEEENRILAHEVASELRQRIAERDLAKRVMTLMKTKIDLYIEASESEKHEFISVLEEKLELKEAETADFRNIIRKQEQEKAGLQNELTLVTSQKSVLGQRVKSFELLMHGHKERVENTILHLQQAAVDAHKKSKEAEEEQAPRKTNREKEEQNHVLCESMSRLQGDQDINMQVACQCGKKFSCNEKCSKNLNVEHMQQELQRLSCVEKTWQGELQASRSEASALNFQLRSLEDNLKNMQDNLCLMKSELCMKSKAENNLLRSQIVALERENDRLARELSIVLNNEQHLPATFHNFDKRKPATGHEVLDAEFLDAKSQPSSRKKDSKSCELTVASVIKALKGNVKIQASPIDLQHGNETVEEFGKDYKDQETRLEVLKVQCSKHVELELLKENYPSLSERRSILQIENGQMVNNMNITVTQLENKVREKEEKIKLLQENKERNSLELSRLRTELGLVQKERDDMQKQAEDLAREALRMSAQVEVLRRKSNQLEDDVLLKEGQISILKGSYEACD